MNIQTVSTLSGNNLKCWEKLLYSTGLSPDGEPDSTVLIWEGSELIATGSRKKNLLKYIAVSDLHQGEDLTATLLTHLRQDAFQNGFNHLFLYTKPKNRILFSSLFFYPIAQTGDVLLMENKRNGIKDFIDSLPVMDGENVGAAVMNCNPFTKGHRHLIESASKKCDRMYVFVLSEESEPFPAADRFELVKKGVSDLKNVTVYPSGPYLISSATFPTYFLKNRDSVNSVHCELDIEIFTKYFAPKFNIKKRFVAKEPFSKMTDNYNKCLMENLPKHNIELDIISRLENSGVPISATKVRELIKLKNADEIKNLVPDVTFDYLKENNYI